MSSIYDIDGLDESQDIWQPGFQEVGARLDEYPGAEDAKRIGQIIPNLNHPSSKQKQALNILQGPGLVQKTNTFSSRDVELVKTDEEKKSEVKQKKVPIWGYNLSYILITQAYIPKDAMIHDKAMGYIDKGKEHFRQLDVVVALTKKVKTMTKDKPQKIDFSTDEKGKELLQKAMELGFADKDKFVYTDKEAEILLSDLDTNAKILPQRAQISFNMVPTLTEKQTQLAKIVQSAHKEEKDLVQRAQSRSIKGG